MVSGKYFQTGLIYRLDGHARNDPFYRNNVKKTPKRCVRALSINPAASVKLRPLKQLVEHACALPCGLAGRILAPTFLVVFADNQQFKGGTSPLLRLSEELRRA